MIHKRAYRLFGSTDESTRPLDSDFKLPEWDKLMAFANSLILDKTIKMDSNRNPRRVYSYAMDEKSGSCVLIKSGILYAEHRDSECYQAFAFRYREDSDFFHNILDARFCTENDIKLALQGKLDAEFLADIWASPLSPDINEKDASALTAVIHELNRNQMVILRLEPTKRFHERARELLYGLYSMMPEKLRWNVGYSVGLRMSGEIKRMGMNGVKLFIVEHDRDFTFYSHGIANDNVDFGVNYSMVDIKGINIDLGNYGDALMQWSGLNCEDRLHISNYFVFGNSGKDFLDYLANKLFIKNLHPFWWRENNIKSLDFKSFVIRFTNTAIFYINDKQHEATNSTYFNKYRNRFLERIKIEIGEQAIEFMLKEYLKVNYKGKAINFTDISTDQYLREFVNPTNMDYYGIGKFMFDAIINSHNMGIVETENASRIEGLTKAAINITGLLEGIQIDMDNIKITLNKLKEANYEAVVNCNENIDHQTDIINKSVDDINSQIHKEKWIKRVIALLFSGIKKSSKSTKQIIL